MPRVMLYSVALVVAAGMPVRLPADGQCDRAFWVDSMIQDRRAGSHESGGRNASFESSTARCRAAVRPEFPAGATLSAKMEERGKDGDLHRSLTLEFPIVNGIGGGVRAYDYEVAVDAICFGGNAQRGVKRYFSPKCHFAPSADTGTMTVTYGLDEFKAWNSLKSRNWGALHVAVRPRETFGATGAAIVAEVKA